MMDERICSCCGRKLPLNSEYFYRDRKSLGGYKANCKNCYEKARGKSFKTGKKTKVHYHCSQCGVEIGGGGSSGYCRSCYAEYQRKRKRQIENERKALAQEVFEEGLLALSGKCAGPQGYAISEPGRIWRLLANRQEP